MKPASILLSLIVAAYPQRRVAQLYERIFGINNNFLFLLGRHNYLNYGN